MTILFADLSRFTTLSSELDPEQVREVVNICFDYLNRPVIKEGGTIHKYEGDLVIALFGLPVAHEDDPEKAIRAALEMLTLMPETNDALFKKLKVKADLGLHIGISSGTVVAGEVGSDEKREYTIMGDVVNFASRLKDVAQDGEIIVSEPVFRASRYLFDYEARPPLRIKGIEEQVRVYQPLRLKEKPEPKRGIKGLASPMVGRNKELDILKGSAESLVKGKGGVLFILGVAGLGKSRLLEELRTHLSDSRLPITQLVGRCLSYGDTMPYRPFLQILENLFDVTEDDSRKTFQEKLVKKTRAIFPDTSSEIVPYLGYLFSIRFADGFDEKVRFLDAQGLKLQMMIALKKLLFALARAQPVLLIIDDYHWIDNESLEFIEFAFRPVPGEPAEPPRILLLALSRIDRESSSHITKERLKKALGSGFQETILSPLDHEDSTKLLHNLLSVPGFTAQFKEQILARAEGNPFFVEEIIRSLIDNGILTFLNGVWSLSQEVSAIKIPDTVQAVIAARMDKLATDVRDVLQTAAVIGRSFYAPLIEQLCTIDSLILSVHLAALEEYEYITEQQQLPEAKYTFRHPLFQDVAYNSILMRRRKQLHGRVGELIEQLYQDRLDEFTDLLAYQYLHSDNSEKALFWLGRAGHRAQSQYANDEAIRYFQMLIATAEAARPGHEYQLCEAYEALGDIRSLQGQHAPAAGFFQKMLDCAQGNPLIQSRAKRKTAQAYVQALRYSEALKILAEAEQALTGSSRQESIERAEVAMVKAGANRLTGDLAGAVAAGQAALDIVERLSSDDVRDTPAPGSAGHDRDRIEKLRAEVYRALAGIAFTQGDLQKAIALTTRALEISEAIGDKQGISKVMGNLGVIHNIIGDYGKAIPYHRRYREIAEEIGDKLSVGAANEHMGFAYWGLGELDEAITYYNAAVRIAEETGDRYGIAGWSINLSGVHKYKGEYAKAFEIVQRAHRILSDSEYESGTAGALAGIAAIYAATGELEKAWDLAHQALQVFKKLDSASYLASTYALLGGLCGARGEHEQARDYLRQTLDGYIKEGIKWGIGTARTSLASLFIETGELDLAGSELSEAEKVLKEIGDKFALIAVYRNMAELKLQEGQAGSPAALQHAQQALNLALKTRARAEEASCYLTIGKLNAAASDFEKAADNFAKAIRIFEEIGSRKLMADAYLENAKVLKKGAGQGVFASGACDLYFDKALEIYKELKLAHRIREITVLRGQV